MANRHDFTISDSEYNQMMVVFDAMRARLATLKEPLTRMIAAQPDQLRAFAATEQGRLLREINRVKQDLDTYFDATGWR